MSASRTVNEGASESNWFFKHTSSLTCCRRRADAFVRVAAGSPLRPSTTPATADVCSTCRRRRLDSAARNDVAGVVMLAPVRRCAVSQRSLHRLVLQLEFAHHLNPRVGARRVLRRLPLYVCVSVESHESALCLANAQTGPCTSSFQPVCAPYPQGAARVPPPLRRFSPLRPPYDVPGARSLSKVL